MRRTALTLALLAAIIALPVSASQWLNGSMTNSASSAAAPGESALGVLLRDPFLIDALSFSPPATIAETETGVAPAQL